MTFPRRSSTVLLFLAPDYAVGLQRLQTRNNGLHVACSGLETGSQEVQHQPNQRKRYGGRNRKTAKPCPPHLIFKGPLSFLKGRIV